MKRTMAHALSVAAAGLPFAFASIRALQTGWDFRYFLIAAAGLIGAAATAAIGRAYASDWTTVTMALVTFVTAALLSVLGAMAIGTRFGLGLLVVAGSFAACFAAAVFFHLHARAGNPVR
jgi:hypothetical protein